MAWSLPLGAARLARTYFRDGSPSEEGVREIRREIRAEIARDAGHLLRAGVPDRAAATSKTFRSLARICGRRAVRRRRAGAAHADAGRPAGVDPQAGGDAADELAALPGVSPSRTHQIVPGALVAEGCMDIFDLTELEICPWALREGVILERLDQISVLDRDAVTRIGLSTSSVYPESTAHAFAYAAKVGLRRRRGDGDRRA